MENSNEIKYLKNIKRYKNYKMFSYDFLFYKAISILYLTLTKKFQMSEIMFITAMFSVSSLFWMYFTNIIIKRVGTKKSIVIGNILVLIEGISYIFSKTMMGFILGDFIGALGFSLKSVSEGNLAYTSLKKLGKEQYFSKVEGVANSKFYYFDAISSLIAGFLFVINNYIPMIFCCINLFISLIISVNFNNIEEEIKNEKTNEVSLNKILKSNRNKSLFIISFLLAGIVAVSIKLYSAILIDLKLDEQYISVLLGIATIFMGIGAKISDRIQKILKNKLLLVFSITYCVCFLIIGIIGCRNKLNLFSLSFYIMGMILMNLIQGSYRVAVKKYLLSFTTHLYIDKIISIYYIFEYLGQAIFLGGSSVVLKYYNNSYTSVIFALLSMILSIIAINYMKDKLGLDAAAYSKDKLN